MRKNKIDSFAVGNVFIGLMVVIGCMFVGEQFRSMKAQERQIKAEHEESNSRKLELIKEYADMRAMLPKCDKVEISYSSMKSPVSSTKYSIAPDQLDKLIANMRDGSGGRLEFSVFSSKAIKPQCNISYATNEYRFDY